MFASGAYRGSEKRPESEEGAEKESVIPPKPNGNADDTELVQCGLHGEIMDLEEANRNEVLDESETEDAEISILGGYRNTHIAKTCEIHR